MPPFLTILTQWLGGKDVMCLGLGVPTEPVPKQERVHKKPGAELLVSEEAAARFFSSALERLRKAGTMGAVISFFSDFDPGLWEIPPLDEDVSGAPPGHLPARQKPEGFRTHPQGVGIPPERRPFPEEPPSWIDISREEYDSDPKLHIRRLYGNYRDYHSGYGVKRMRRDQGSGIGVRPPLAPHPYVGRMGRVLTPIPGP